MEITICIGVCLLDRDGYCIGCKRSITEIANWSYYTDSEKTEIANKVKNRITAPPIYQNAETNAAMD
jgi:uncharacterized protein